MSPKSFRFNTESFLHSPEIAKMCQKCSRIPSLRTRCSRIPVVLVRTTVKLRQGLAHHGEFGLAVSLECVGVTLPQHLGHKMIGHSARAQACGKSMTQLVQRKMRYAGPSKRGSPNLLEAADMRLLTAWLQPGKQVVRSGRLLHLRFEGLVGGSGHRHGPNPGRGLASFYVNSAV